MSEETCKYQKQWDEYQNDKGRGCFWALLFFPIFAFILYLAKRFPEYAEAMFIGFFLIIAALSFLIKSPKWACPRCGGVFYGRYKSQNIFRAQNCIDCALPIYYGSSYFWNHWGTKRGNEEVQKVREQEKLNK